MTSDCHYLSLWWKESALKSAAFVQAKQFNSGRIKPHYNRPQETFWCVNLKRNSQQISYLSPHCSQWAAVWKGILDEKLQSVLHPWCVSVCLTGIRAANKDGIGLHMPVRSLENRTSQFQNISWLQITKTPASNSHICIKTWNLRHTSILFKMYRNMDRQRWVWSTHVHSLFIIKFGEKLSFTFSEKKQIKLSVSFTVDTLQSLEHCSQRKMLLLV